MSYISWQGSLYQISDGIVIHVGMGLVLGSSPQSDRENDIYGLSAKVE